MVHPWTRVMKAKGRCLEWLYKKIRLIQNTYCNIKKHSTPHTLPIFPVLLMKQSVNPGLFSLRLTNLSNHHLLQLMALLTFMKLFFLHNIDNIYKAFSPSAPSQRFFSSQFVHPLSTFLTTNTSEHLNIWLLNLTPLPVSLAQFQLVHSKTSCLLILPITHMLNRSLATGYVQLGLKIAAITPVLKKPGLDNIDWITFRPISNIPLLVWFSTSHSTETALLRVVNDLHLASDTGAISLLVLLDLSEAFLICLLLVMSFRG